VDRGQLDSAAPAQFHDAGDERTAGVVGSRVDLVHADLVGVRVEQRKVGERATNVYADELHLLRTPHLTIPHIRRLPPAMGLSVCVVGLGLMGRPIARTLSAAGIEVKGWNRSALSPEAIGSIELVDGLEAAARADVILIVVSDTVATGVVLEGLLSHLRAGSVVLDM